MPRTIIKQIVFLLFACNDLLYIARGSEQYCDESLEQVSKISKRFQGGSEGGWRIFGDSVGDGSNLKTALLLMHTTYLCVQTTAQTQLKCMEVQQVCY